MTQILDAKYNKVDLGSIVRDNCKHLSAEHQKKLLQLLTIYEWLFNSTLGDWRSKQVSFQIKEGTTCTVNHGAHWWGCWWHCPAFSLDKATLLRKKWGRQGWVWPPWSNSRGSDLACGLCFASLLGVDKNQNSIQKHLAWVKKIHPPFHLGCPQYCSYFLWKYTL